MLITDLENDEALIVNSSWGPEDDNWEDEDDEDFEDEDFDDRLQDMDDLHEIQADDYIGEPDPEDDDHFPEEYEDEDDE